MQGDIKKSPFMDAALAEAKKSEGRDEVPIGAVIVDDKGNIISSSGNRIRELKDPTAHAEIIAIREAAKKLSSERMSNCDLYVSLEPCPMCAQAIAFARIRALYYGASDEKGGGVENGPRIFSSSSCHHKPEIYSGIYQRKCSEILKNFFRKKRS